MKNRKSWVPENFRNFVKISNIFEKIKNFRKLDFSIFKGISIIFEKSCFQKFSIFSKMFEILKIFRKIFGTQLFRFFIFDIFYRSFWFFFNRRGFSRRIRIYCQKLHPNSETRRQRPGPRGVLRNPMIFLLKKDAPIYYNGKKSWVEKVSPEADISRDKNYFRALQFWLRSQASRISSCGIP